MPQYNIQSRGLSTPPSAGYKPNNAAIGIGNILGNTLRAPDPRDEKTAIETEILKAKQSGDVARADYLARQYRTKNPDADISSEVFQGMGGKDFGEFGRSQLPYSTAAENQDYMSYNAAVGKGTGVNEAYTSAGQEAVAKRNLSDELAVSAAKPESFNEYKADLYRRTEAGESDIPMGVQHGAGLIPKRGMSISSTPDGGFTFSQGDVGDQLSPTKTITGQQQQQVIEGNSLNNLLDRIEALVDEHPEYVGASGNIQRGAQSAADIATSIGALFGSPEELSQELRNAQGQAEKFGLSLEFNSDLHDLKNLGNLVVLKAAAAVAQQSGRDLSDKDVSRMFAITGDPTGWAQSPQAYKSGIKQLRSIVNQNIGQAEGVLKQGIGSVLQPQTRQLQPKPAPQAPQQSSLSSQEESEYQELKRLQSGAR